jgi:hypothetical protein
MVKYKYKRLPIIGIKIARDVFQNVISKLVQDMEYVKAKPLESHVKPRA